MAKAPQEKPRYYPELLVFKNVRSSFEHLSTPDPDRDPTKPAKYKLSFYPDMDDPQLEALLEFTKQCRAEDDDDTPNRLPNLKKDRDGVFYIQATKSAAKGKPTVVGPDKQPYTEDIWRGSTVTVVVQPAYWKINGGCALYLEVVQIHENAKDTGGGSSNTDAALALLDGDTMEAALSSSGDTKSAAELLASLD